MSEHLSSATASGTPTPLHEHEWQLIAEEKITYDGKGYVWGWGSEATVTYQTGLRRRFFCVRCRETAEDVEKFERERRLTR